MPAAFLIPQSTQASGFNPGELTTNSIFIARDSMSLADIQSFLEQKGSVLAHISSSYLGEGANGRSAARIIYDASRQSISNFGGSNRPSNPFTVALNPQVILSTLQKETSLITGSYTVGSPTLENMLRIAMGYGCPDSGGCNPDYEGFANQVKYGAAQLWLDYWRANNGTPAGFPVGSSQTLHNNPVYPPYCPSGGSISFTVGNAATSSLYRYTPHVCNGNANFYHFMTTWFPTKTNAFIRDSRLVKGSGPDVFIWWEEKNLRWYVPNWAILQDWGLNGKTLEIISDGQLNAIPRASGELSRIVRGSNGPDVFFMQNGYKRYVRSYASLGDYGVSSADVRVIEGFVMAEYLEGLPLGSLVGGFGSPDIFLSTAARRHYVASWYTIGNWGFSGNDVRWIEPSVLETWPQSSQIEWLVKREYSPDAFLVSDSQRHFIPTASLLVHWGLAGVEIKTVGNDALDQLPSGKNLTRVARGSSNDVYFIENGKKRYVRTAARLSTVGHSMNDLVRVSDPLLDRLPTGTPL